MNRMKTKGALKTVAYPKLVGGIGALLVQSRRAMGILSTVLRESLVRFSIWQTLSAESLDVADIFQMASEKSATVLRKFAVFMSDSLGSEECGGMLPV